MTSDNEVFEFAGRRVEVIDLSTTLANSATDADATGYHIDYHSHEDLAEQSEGIWGLGPNYWRDGKAGAMETVTLSTHSGTHIDAPIHYAPESAGKPAVAIDKLPFRWVMGDAFVLDATSIDREKGMTKEDVIRELDRIGYKIKPFDIALIRTDASLKFGQAGYDKIHAGLRRCATKYLVESGVKLIGIDAWGLDRPFDVMVKEAKAGDTQQLWETHYFGAENPYSQIENLSNLSKLPRNHGFQVLALPVKISGASAGWARVVALV